MDHAIRIALTVQEVQNQERFNNSFYTRFESSPKLRSERERYSAPRHIPNPSRKRKFSGYKTTAVQESRNAVSRNVVRINTEQGVPMIQVQIGGKPRSLIIDTGSCVSILKPGVSRGKIEATNLLPHGVTGEVLAVEGQQTLPLVIAGSKFYHTFVISPLPTEAADLLGTDFLARNGAVVDLGNDKFILPEISGETPTKHAAVTIFLKSKEGRSPQLSAEVGQQRKVTSPPESSSTHDNSWIVKAAENVELAPRSRQVVPAKLELGKKRNLPELICVEPATIPIEGILPALTVSRVSKINYRSLHVTNKTDRAETELAQLDFVVEHKAGSKIGHVDALSRHVATISNPGRLSRENFSNEQKAAYGANDQGAKHRPCCKLKPRKDSTTRTVSKELANPQKKNSYESSNLRIELSDRSH
jgi:hypothetical protein